MSIDFLKERSNEGFFLMIEGSQIDWGGHANDPEYVESCHQQVHGAMQDCLRRLANELAESSMSERLARKLFGPG